MYVFFLYGSSKQSLKMKKAEIVGIALWRLLLYMPQKNIKWKINKNNSLQHSIKSDTSKQ